MSFFTYAVKERLGQENKLVRIEAIIDWQPVKEKLAKIYKNEYQTVAGVKPYSSLSMFKAILLQSWHSLSDPKLEEALRVRIDFMLFTGMGIEQATPDETTICRLRNRLVTTGLDKKLFEEINKQLELRGLKIEKATGAVIDASVIESAAKPNRCINIAVDRNEEAEIKEESNAEICESVDPDAKWLKNGSKSHFGYKLFLAADDQDGYAAGIDVTPANRSETKHFAEFIEKIPCKKGMRMYGDKAYASKENQERKPLTARQKQKNLLISARRYIVEQGYGTFKRILKFDRASYIGIAKVQGQAFRKAICFNLLKAVNKIKIYDWLPREWCIQLQLI